MKNTFIGISILVLTSLFVSCKSYTVKPDITGQERFELALRMFKNKDYFDAKNQFKILTLNNPGATFVDEAQFRLAECHFNMKEYVLAADEFSRLIRLYPKSQWVDDAQFKTALCDFRLSPKSSLDQTYTVKAVENLQRFIEDYPSSILIPEAERLLRICRTKLADKEYKAAKLYRRLGDYQAAYVYYKSVVDNYYDTEFFERATFWKAESLYKLERISEARFAFEELLRKFPESSFVDQAKNRLEEIEASFTGVSETNGVSKKSDPAKL